MKLTFYSEYGLRIIIYLLLHPDEVVPTRVIAEKFQISVNHLNKVSQKLANLGIVEASRGKRGGIILKESSLKLKLGDLIQSIELPTEVAQCGGSEKLPPCVLAPACHLRTLLAEAQTAFWDHLNNYQISDLAPNSKKKALKALFYPNDDDTEFQKSP